MKINLTELKNGESGNIVEIHGGHGFLKRMENIGIRVGKKITKGSSQFLKGPQTVKVDNMQFAIGFGMAKKIFVEIEK